MVTSTLVPLGYYKDPDKSAETFQTIDGVRYSFPGDYATVAADGSITLLGRGSACINTAGEKVFPEEVEESLKRHAGVSDALVIGMPDETFGQTVIAVCSLSDQGRETDGEGLEASILQHCADELAGYKTPRQVLVLEEVRRAPNGKADYKWARQYAETRLNQE